MIYISWENTQVGFELITSTDKELMNYIDDYLLTKKEKIQHKYSNAAEQLYFLNRRLNDAIKLTDIALELDEKDGFARRVKMDIYEKLRRYDEALRIIEQAIEIEGDENEIIFWQQQKERIRNKN